LSRPILVTGFGPFEGVADNPSARLACAVDGRRIDGHTVRGVVLDVSYERGPARAIAVARTIDAAFVLGLGVHRRDDRLHVERVGRNVGSADRDDVDGRRLDRLGDGPERVGATLDVEVIAEVLGAERSDDAGRYVCNAWLYRVASALPERPVGFLHVPPSGLAVDALVRALSALSARHPPSGSSWSSKSSSFAR
jgi:pyroglutamyl-peptidase